MPPANRRVDPADATNAAIGGSARRAFNESAFTRSRGLGGVNRGGAMATARPKAPPAKLGYYCLPARDTRAPCRTHQLGGKC